MSSAAPKTPGRLSRALLRLLMRRATIAEIERLDGEFRLITLEGDALKDVAWIPGQKIQIAMGSAFVARTYTPIEWDASVGRTRLLGYAHGEGPGSAWVLGVERGDECDLFGPRNSLEVRQIAGPLAVFGDETSIGLAYALARHNPVRPVVGHFEVGNVQTGKQVVTQLGLDDSMFLMRRDNDAHLDELEAALPALAASGASFVLTGKAGTIQRLRQSLKRQAVGAERVVTKAYWAPGKTGLD